MVGWLSGFRAQTGSAAYWCYTKFIRCLGEAAVPGGGKCGSCPDFASNTLAFALQLRKITENISHGNRMALGCSVPNTIRFVDLAMCAMASTGLLFPSALGFRVTQWGQPSVSISICRVAVLGVSSHQLT